MHIRYLDDFDSYSGYGYAYRDKTADGTVAYTYTARYKADESKVGAETDIGSWFDEKGVTLKVWNNQKLQKHTQKLHFEQILY